MSTDISAVVGTSTTKGVRELATRVGVSVKDVDKSITRLLARNVSPNNTSDVGIA